ncbi:hypothetical protein KIL84_022179 [Mauremys mutica]|uniref:Secreted protein n=1 Tax=Mauremys mutica TaxID=74926 RepID=A0A9D3X868_9SAUR|nr:hypothetical protein KIL84_022179 [Mauremys mutica]
MYYRGVLVQLVNVSLTFWTATGLASSSVQSGPRPATSLAQRVHTAGPCGLAVYSRTTMFLTIAWGREAGSLPSPLSPQNSAIKPTVFSGRSRMEKPSTVT